MLPGCWYWTGEEEDSKDGDSCCELLVTGQQKAGGGFPRLLTGRSSWRKTGLSAQLTLEARLSFWKIGQKGCGATIY